MDHDTIAHSEIHHGHVNGVTDEHGHPEENSTMTYIREGAEAVKERAETALEDLGHAAETVVRDVKEFFTGDSSEPTHNDLADVAAHSEERRISHSSQGHGSRKGSQAEAAHSQPGSRRGSRLGEHHAAEADHVSHEHGSIRESELPPPPELHHDTESFRRGSASDSHSTTETHVRTADEHAGAAHSASAEEQRRASRSSQGHGSRRGSQAQTSHEHPGSRRGSALSGHHVTGGEHQGEEQNFPHPDADFLTASAPPHYDDFDSERRALADAVGHHQDTNTHVRGADDALHGAVDAEHRRDSRTSQGPGSRRTSHAEERRASVPVHNDLVPAHDTDTFVRTDPILEINQESAIGWHEDHRELPAHEPHALHTDEAFAVHDDENIDGAAPPQYAPMPPPLMQEALPVGVPAMFLRSQEQGNVEPYMNGTDTFVQDAEDALGEMRRSLEEHDKHIGTHGLFGQPSYRLSNVHMEVDDKHCAVCTDSVDHESHVELHGKHFHRNCFDTAHSGECSGCYKKILLMEPSVSVASIGRDWHAGCLNCGTCNSPIHGPFQLRNQIPTCDDCFVQHFAPHCAACTRAIEGNRLKAMGSFWHPDCFVCVVCHESLGKDGAHEFFRVEGQPYCRKDVEAAHMQVVN